MTLLADLTRSSLRLRSPLIVERLLRSAATLDAAELLGSVLGTSSWIAFKEISAALAEAEFDVEIAVKARDGEQPVCLKRTMHGVVICEGTSAGEIVWELCLLDPDSSVRMSALETLADAALPCLPNEVRWRAILISRALTPLELDQFVGCILSSANAKLTELGEALSKTDKVDSRGLLPTSRTYYESLIGDIPSPGTTASEYLVSVLYPHLRAVFKHDRRWGWWCAQAAFVGPSVDLGELFADMSDDDLTAMFEGFEPLSPLAHVAKLSACLPRAPKNPKVLALAKRCVEELIETTQKQIADQGPIALFHSLVRLTLLSLGAEEETSNAPAYWRRLAAFSHANMLLQFLDFTGVEPVGFETWVNSVKSGIGDIRTYTDAWTEPAWLPDSDYLFSPWVAAAGMAMKLCSDSAVGDAVFDDPIETRLDVPPGQTGFARLFSELPDLLQGDLRASDRNDPPMTDEQEAMLIEQLTIHERYGTLLVLLLHARAMRFPERLRATFLKWIRDLAESEPRDNKKALTELCVVARIAAVQADEEIANAAVGLAFEILGSDSSTDLCSMAWLCIVLAGGAFVAKDARDDWLDGQLLGLAHSTPKGDPSVDLAGRIELMQRLQPTTSRRFTRARYAALAAVT